MPEITFPYTCNPPPARLPRRPREGQTICDIEGNIWQYDIVGDAWINRGTLDAPVLVTENTDGLVDPDVFERLSLLRTATNSGRSLPEELKIIPHTDVYWYLFHSSDKLIRFTPEGPSILRLEVDRGRLFTLIAGNSCRGPKGKPGDKGLPGDDGEPGGPEPCFAPGSLTDNGTRLNFDLVVPAPLATDIILRLAAAATSPPVVTIAVTPAGSASLQAVGPDIPLDRTRTLASITYNVMTQRLAGAFIRTSGRWSERCILACQKGPTGDSGDPGTCILRTSECEVTYSDIQFTSPLVAIRKGCNSNQLLTLSANLFGKVCVNTLAFDVGSPDYLNLFSGSMVIGRTLAARKTLEPCKDVAIYRPDLVVAKRPELELPEWQPQKDCNVAKRAQLSDLNWVPATDIPATDIPATSSLWSDPTGTIAPKYPWLIMVAQAEDAGNCDPCVETDREEPPCPTNQTTTTTTQAPTQYQLRSRRDNSCICVLAQTPLGQGDVVLSTHDTLSDCQAAQTSICDAVGVIQYQIRKNLQTGQCACASVATALGPDDVVLGTFNSLLECETQRSLLPDCAAESGSALWFNYQESECYCTEVGQTPSDPTDFLLGAYVTPAQCATFCMPNQDGGTIVLTCGVPCASRWATFVTGTIIGWNSTSKNVALYYNSSSGLWELYDEDRTQYLLQIVCADCMAYLIVAPAIGTPFTLTSPIIIGPSGQPYLRFENTVDFDHNLNLLYLYGKLA